MNTGARLAKRTRKWSEPSASGFTWIRRDDLRNLRARSSTSSNGRAFASVKFKTSPAVESLSSTYSNRTVSPSVGGQLVEIQIRSRLQHLWAELSEKFSDVVDPAIKYGGGRENIRGLLTASSIMVQEYERVEKTWVSSTGEPGEARSGAEIRDTLTNMKEEIAHIFADLITTVERGRPAQ